MSRHSGHDYTPISCAVHSEYELAILHKQQLHLTWLDADNQQQTAYVIPVDIRTREHQEFLVADLPDKTRLEIRLDRISAKT